MKKNLLFLLAVLLSFPLASEAKTQSAKVTFDISGGLFKSVRLKNLPRDSAVKVDITCDGVVMALITTEEQYRKYPNIDRPLFQTAVNDRFNFTVAIPATGNYYLIFDNSAGSRLVKVDAVITGASGSDTDLLQGNRDAGQGNSGRSSLSSAGKELSALFVFKPFTVSIKKCAGRDTSFRSENLTLCREYAESLADTLGPQKAATALQFTLYHEAGHILLAQWGYPFSDLEEIANEFAAMVFALLDQGDRLSSLLEGTVAHPRTKDLLAGSFKGRLHPLAPDQADHVLTWVKDNQRLKRWQKVFVPHMQTALLQRISKNPPLWADAALVKNELTRRKEIVF